MPEWKYLWSEPFQARYAVAAWALRHCKHVVEIGGYRTPIVEFLPLDVGAMDSVTVYDPKLLAPQEWMYTGGSGKVRCRLVATPFQPDDPLLPSRQYGVAILGLDLHMTEEDWQKLFTFLRRADRVVIEYATDHVHALEQYNRILKGTNFQKVFGLYLDLAGNDFGDLTDSAPPMTRRWIVALEPKKETI